MTNIVNNRLMEYCLLAEHDVVFNKAYTVESFSFNDILIWYILLKYINTQLLSDYAYCLFFMNKK